MTGRARGSFVWADLVPGDQDRAIAFYVELLGWWTLKAAPEDGGYAVAFLGEQGLDATVGGIGKTIPGVPPVWTPYLATDDLDATVALATEHGGRVIMPVHEAPGLGRVAIVTEPHGVPFGLWEAGAGGADVSGPGAAAQPPTGGMAGFGAAAGPGAFAWMEFVVPDAALATAFFKTLFGMRAEAIAAEGAAEEADDGGASADAGRGTDGEPDPFVYRSLFVPGEDEPQFGVRQSPDAVTNQLYVRVADPDAAADAVASAGGEVVRGPDPSPFGAIVELIDTEGATLRLVGPAE